MNQPRISPLEPPYEPIVAEELEKIMPPGIPPLKLFKTLAHNPRILTKFRQSNLLDRGSIERQDREIVILRTCARCGAEYEWGVHVAFFAGRFGLTEAQIEATFSGSPEASCWSESQQMLIRLADELHDSADISDDLWSALSSRWEPAQIIEFMVLAGFYHTVSYVINGARIDLEDLAPRFPA
jgi:alkylhydroperoxidase family enzyme